MVGGCAAWSAASRFPNVLCTSYCLFRTYLCNIEVIKTALVRRKFKNSVFSCAGRSMILNK